MCMIDIAIKAPDLAEQRMIDPLWLGDVGEVVEDDQRPHPLEDWLDSADLAGGTLICHRARLPAWTAVDHLRALLDKGRTWVKLSGAYADATAVAQAYVKAAPERLVWDSDRPHPGVPETKPDDAVLFDLLLECAPDEAMRYRILFENRAILYDYPTSA